MGSSVQSSDKTLGLGLKSPSFLALLVTQWLTAINDNVFRWLVIGIGKDFFDVSRHGEVLFKGTVCFVFPYLVLSPYAGYLADRFPKRWVIIGCKILEVVVMLFAVVAIQLQSFNLLLVAVAMMGGQSALFAPAKMGAIPEMLAKDKISGANGWFGLSTFTAIIIGMVIGGWLADFTSPHGTKYLPLTLVVLVGLAAVGTAFSVLVKGLPSANPDLKFPILGPFAIVSDLQKLFSYKHLFVVALGIVYFWSIASVIQLNVDSLASENGSWTEVQRNPLLVSIVLGIGIGSVIAGWLSAGRIELGLLPFGAIGLCVFSILIFFVPGGYLEQGVQMNSGLLLSCLFLGLLGISGGIYDVPLASYIQEKTPPEIRGKVLAATNFMLFLGVALSSVVFGIMRAPTTPGSLVVLESKFNETLTEDQRLELDQLVKEFGEKRDSLIGEDGNQSLAVETFLNQKGNSSPSKTMLANLFWKDFELQRENLKSLNEQLANKKISLEEYEKRPKVIDVDKYFKTYGQKSDKLDTEMIQLVKNVYETGAPAPRLSARQIFFVVAMTVVPVIAFAFWRLSQAAFRFVGWMIARCFFKIRINGEETLPSSGAVLICNNISTVDKLLLILSTPRKLRWVEDQSKPSKWSNFWGAINIGGGPTKQQQGFAEARKALKRGEILAIFPQNKVSKSGYLLNPNPTYLKLLKLVPVPLIPVYFDEAWTHVIPKNKKSTKSNVPPINPLNRQPISIHYGEPFTYPQDMSVVRNALQHLGAKTMDQRASQFVSPQQGFIRSCKKRKFGQKTGDSTGVKMSGGMLLMRTLILRNLLNRHVLEDKDEYVGVLLPPTVPGLVVNLALSLDKRIAVNLNYTASSDVLNACLKHAGITKILTSEKVMSKLELELDANVVFIDDLKTKVTTGDKVSAAINTFVKPASMLESSLGLNDIKPDDVLTIIFTSGSTGIPKGVMLTHGNIASNVEGVQSTIQLTREDVITGILPFFHSFGYLATVWFPMMEDISSCYHFTPLDGRQVGKLVRQFGCTCLLATPTFLRTYLRRTPEEDFKTLDVVVAGAEKLPPELAQAFKEKFNVLPTEGYGATELSPVAAVNVPPSRSPGADVLDAKEGTVGRPLPHIIAKVTDLDTGKDLDQGETGMLWFKGPNVMKGYLNREDLTAETIIDGWYKTGDVGRVDEDGFVVITGRQSRFSKIGGEMVPHILIEETLAKLIGADEEEGLKAVVTAVPDEKKGERLIVIHTELEQDVAELRNGLSDEGLPNIYIPSQDSFKQVDEIPILGTGKLDLHGLKKVAMDHYGPK